MKPILPLITFFLLLPTIFAVNAQDNQCSAVDCDCEHITDPGWREQCRTYQAGLRKGCSANQGKPLSYCGLHGPGGRPVALSVQLSESETVDESGIHALEKRIKSLVFSARNDLDTGRALDARGDYAQALSILKEYDKAQSLVHGYRQQIASSWIALDEAGKAEKLWDEVVGVDDDLEKIFRSQAETVWAKSREPGLKPKEKRLLQYLAMRYLGNGGNYLERVADAYARAGNIEAAAAHWERAAKLAEQLVDWKVEAKSKPMYVRYYSYQTAARWHRAAIYWMQLETKDQATLSLSKAQGLLDLLGADSSFSGPTQMGTDKQPGGKAVSLTTDY